MSFFNLSNQFIQWDSNSGNNVSRHVIALCCCAFAVFAPPVSAQHAEEAKNMELVGYSDLQARSAYQPTIQNQNGRWIAYVGHHGGSAASPKPVNSLNGRPEFNGTSIIDVTDPKQPKYLYHIPGEEGLDEGGGAQMVRVCPGKGLPKGNPDKFYMLRVFGNSAHEVWDVTNPSAPVRIAEINNVKGTHKNFWECDTGIAYLVSGLPGWRTRRMTQIYDLSDPAKPVFIRNFGLPGQQPGSTGPTPEELHGPISTGPAGNRVYFGYGTNKNGMLQIVDRKKLLTGPTEPTNENLLFPQIGKLEMSPKTGAHTAFPILGVDIPGFAKDRDSKRDFVLIVNESLVNECAEARQMAWVADISVETKPQMVSNFTVPESSGNFCSRGGRFGTHSSNESFTPAYYKRVVFLAHFNAGVRAVDIRDPFNLKEIASYIPATTDKTTPRCVKVDGKDRCKVAIQTNNVEVDDRGYIYIVDRASTGLHILQLTGEARKVANLSK
ncbi:MAG TPA: hypothetical protein VGO51_11330 [Burkholderiaceae bacterium]|jgi:hypothetical protein|nr:hypothetical protein [Burkholderiaceae bacterium]